MEMRWPPAVTGGLFCDRRDFKGLYYWYDAVQEIIKWSKLKKGESMRMTFDIKNGH